MNFTDRRTDNGERSIHNNGGGTAKWSHCTANRQTHGCHNYTTGEKLKLKNYRRNVFISRYERTSRVSRRYKTRVSTVQLYVRRSARFSATSFRRRGVAAVIVYLKETGEIARISGTVFKPRKNVYESFNGTVAKTAVRHLLLIRTRDHRVPPVNITAAELPRF